MEFVKNHFRDGMFLCMAVILCSFLEWDKNAVKCFISGGAISVCLTLRIMRSKLHESKRG